MECQLFRRAIILVENFIENDYLMIYFAHICINELDNDNDNIFDETILKKYTNQTREFLIDLLSKLNFSLKELKDEYSMFYGNKNLENPSEDCIYYASSIINGLKLIENSPNIYGKAIIEKCIFFLFIKTLHELANACNFQSNCRFMTNEEEGPCVLNVSAIDVSTPKAGNAIERYICGSLLEVIGNMIKKDNKNIFIIHNIYLSETKPSRVISKESIDLFFKSNIKTIGKIPDLGGDILISPTLEKLSTKHRKSTSSNSSKDYDNELETSDDDNESETSDDDIHLNLDQEKTNFTWKT